MTDTDTTTRTVPPLAIVALVAGLGSLVLLATLPRTDIGWATVAAIAAITAGTVAVIDAVRAGRDASWLAIIGAIVAVPTLIMVAIAIM